MASSNQLSNRMSFFSTIRLSFFALLCALLLMPFAVSAQGFVDGVRSGAQSTAEGAGVNTPLSLEVVIGNVINVVLSFLGVFLLAYFLYAGFLWMTAGGDKDKVEKAKKIMMNAVIGLIIIVLSYAITDYVLAKLAGIAPTSGISVEN